MMRTTTTTTMMATMMMTTWLSWRTTRSLPHTCRYLGGGVGEGGAMGRTKQLCGVCGAHFLWRAPLCVATAWGQQQQQASVPHSLLMCPRAHGRG